MDSRTVFIFKDRDQDGLKKFSLEVVQRVWQISIVLVNIIAGLILYYHRLGEALAVHVILVRSQVWHLTILHWLKFGTRRKYFRKFRRNLEGLDRNLDGEQLMIILCYGQVQTNQQRQDFAWIRGRKETPEGSWKCIVEQREHKIGPEQGTKKEEGITALQGKCMKY